MAGMHATHALACVLSKAYSKRRELAMRRIKSICLPYRTIGSSGLPLMGLSNTVVLAYVSLLLIQKQANITDTIANTVRKASK